MKKLFKSFILGLFLVGCQENHDILPNTNLDISKNFETQSEYESFISSSTFLSLTSEEKLDYFRSDEGLIRIGDYLMKIDLDDQSTLVTKNFDLAEKLRNSETDNSEIGIFSTMDNVLELLDKNVDGTVSDITELKEYNKKFENQVRLVDSEKSNNSLNSYQTSFTFTTSNLSTYTLASNANRPFTYGPYACGFEPGFGTPNGPSNNTNLVYRFVDFNRSSSCDQAAYFDIIYIRAAVYFELKTQLTYIRNNNSYNNSELKIFNDFYYERRVRFGSNQKVTSTNTRTGLNTSQIEQFIYSGSRSLKEWNVQSKFNYNNMPGCCSTSVTSREINTIRVYFTD